MNEKAEALSFEQLIANEEPDQLLNLARLTEGAERYEEMCLIMGAIVKKKVGNGGGLSVEERNMLSVAYKNVVGARRAAWRSLKDSEGDTDKQQQKNKPKTDEEKSQDKARNDYRAVVETELQAKCAEVLDLLKDNLLCKNPEADHKTLMNNLENAVADKEAKEKELETQVFYLKMSGDYYRYLAEFLDDEKHKKQAEEKYKAALNLAGKLAPTHPTRLGLALNASVCYWEILKKPNAACELAKKAFDEAIQKLDSLSDSTYKDSTLIMQLLRDNLTIWTSNTENDQGGKKAEPEEDD